LDKKLMESTGLKVVATLFGHTIRGSQTDKVEDNLGNIPKFIASQTEPRRKLTSMENR